jgi:Fur family transcriptional regulator, peroxide stress response regulator
VLDREVALARLKEEGLRLTPQRRAVIDALAGNRSHPSAEEIGSAVAAQTPGVSLSTVYSALRELASLGLVRQLELPGSMRFDPDTSGHAHLLCEECGAVLDIELPDDFAQIMRLPEGVALKDIQVSLTGRCAHCERAAGQTV